MSKEVPKKNDGHPQTMSPRLVRQMIHRLPKLYLVGITGMTSFILENLKGVKFKVTIGQELRCTCSSVSIQCLHTLHVLTEIFKIPQQHELLLKVGYRVSELRYLLANRRITQNKVADFLKAIKPKLPPPRQVIMETLEEEQEERLCLICHLQIVKSDEVFYCLKVCLNIFHLECYGQWIKHQNQKGLVTRCPVCRDEQNPSISSYVIDEMRQKEKERIEHIQIRKVGKEYSYYCDGCQLRELSLEEPVYKCIECEDVTFCQNCFRQGKHIKHSFLSKMGAHRKWKECEDRKGKKKWDSQQGLIRIKVSNTRRLSNFIACGLPCYFSKNTRWNILECRKFDIRIEDLECTVCIDKQKAFLRRMPCGHFIHHKCLRRRIEKGRLFCKLDGQKFLFGYESLRKHELLNHSLVELDEPEEQQREEKGHSPAKSLRMSTSSQSTRYSRRIDKNRSMNEEQNRSLVRHSNFNPE